jgi:transcriptional regulator with XRE-family HTH domain
MESATPVPPAVGVALREARIEAGLSATETAYIAGVTEGAIHKIESGGSRASGPTILALMRGVPGFATRLGFQTVSHAA